MLPVIVFRILIFSEKHCPIFYVSRDFLFDGTDHKFVTIDSLEGFTRHSDRLGTACLFCTMPDLRAAVFEARCRVTILKRTNRFEFSAALFTAVS
jgi:hypothetical protein